MSKQGMACLPRTGLLRFCCGEAGRRDDLWSWLYILVEMLEGTLPWRMISPDSNSAAGTSAEHNPKSIAMHMKQRCLEDPQQLASSGSVPGASVLQGSGISVLFPIHVPVIPVLQFSGAVSKLSCNGLCHLRGIHALRREHCGYFEASTTAGL
jgi:hypothetical protein